MKFVLTRVLVLAVVLAAAAHAFGQSGAQVAEPPLTNASVMKLVRAGFRERTLIAIINVRPVSFDLAPERLIELKKGGVSERVILAMIGRAGSVEVSSDDFGDDEGFFGSDGGTKGQVGGTSNPGSVDIFGSSGGSRGRMRSRGGNGGMDNDTQTTGSATVRIMRPPAEAGGAQTKLERTPTLSNDSVVELVEAGFSEGTIIRRIEQSPVEFDLAPARLAELRKRRVTEPVIAAMRAAMGEDNGPPAQPEK